MNNIPDSQDPSNITPPLDSQPKKLKTLSLWIGLVILTALFGYFYLQQNTKKENSTEELQEIPNQSALVNFTTPTPIFSEVILKNIREKGQEFGYDFVYNFNKIGDITDGEYKGGQLILASAYADDVCKGDQCDPGSTLRYILFENTAILLPQISEDKSTHELSTQNPFQKFGYSLSKDNIFTIPILEYPKTITGTSSDQVLYYIQELNGKIDLNQIHKISSNNIFGDIYTNRQDLSEEEKEKIDLYYNQNHPELANLFSGDQFYVFRPDGTFLVYDISTKSFRDAASSYNGEYDGVIDCATISSVSVVENNILNEDKDLKKLVVPYGKDDLYIMKDRNHSLLKDFYQKYQEAYIDKEGYYYNTENSYHSPGEELRTYEQFVTSNPIVFWRDPFGRLIRFNKTYYIPVSMCEPIIYLYPETEQNIDIKLNSLVNVFASTPVYDGGWNVTAKPSGEITDVKTNKKYPYLFWEGSSYIFEMPKAGFVVEKSNVTNFLEDTVLKLGLNEKEKNDFIKSWAPELSHAPYYFITFLDQNFIDKIAPLEISPNPKTIIRILMDYKPLTGDIEVEPLILPTPPKREGFTVVEWGGLKR